MEVQGAVAWKVFSSRCYAYKNDIWLLTIRNDCSGISPFFSKNDQDIRLNPHSWLNTANLLFLDQSVGTGMSYTHRNEHSVDEETTAKDFYDFLCRPH